MNVTAAKIEKISSSLLLISNFGDIRKVFPTNFSSHLGQTNFFSLSAVRENHRSSTSLSQWVLHKISSSFPSLFNSKL